MLFPTVDYGIFFLGAFATVWGLRRSPRAQKTALVVGSCAFYGFWDWRFVPLLVGISLLAAAVARALQVLTDERRRKWLVAAGITACLLTLSFFKYLAFAATNLLGLFRVLGISLDAGQLPEIVLPVGISFFVFHAISLMVDAYRGQITVRIRPLDALLYVAFFPQLVAGPILRASKFLPQLTAPRPVETIDAARALELIAIGLAKKVLIAQLLGSRLVDPVFEAPGAHSGLEALLGIYGYAVQIYCDFSGYSDIAIGSALLLGFHIPENFDAPYRATSPQDFWRRWHISLSSWLRDYLFIPLGGSKHGRGRTLLNLAITLVLGGLWHGPAWTFVAWGAFHATWLVAHRCWAEAKLPAIVRFRQGLAWRVAAPLLTFHCVCLGWVLFRASSLQAAGELLSVLFAGGLHFSLGAAPVLAIAIGLGGQLRARGPSLRLGFSRLPLAVQGLVFAVGVLLIESLGPRGIAPFIYFRF